MHIWLNLCIFIHYKYYKYLCIRWKLETHKVKVRCTKHLFLYLFEKLIAGIIKAHNDECLLCAVVYIMCIIIFKQLYAFTMWTPLQSIRRYWLFRFELPNLIGNSEGLTSWVYVCVFLSTSAPNNQSTISQSVHFVKAHSNIRYRWILDFRWSVPRIHWNPPSHIRLPSIYAYV